MTTATFHPRRLGARLLVAPLGEDCLGSVYRALHATDERRFVRLRVLQSPELSPAAVFAAIARNEERVTRLSHKAIVQHAELSVENGTPFVAWYESAGWTLDYILSRLRSASTPLPIPFGLLIAERVCAALEHAWFSPVDGEPICHGLLWPGFVSISNDAEVRLGGFGLAEAVLPSLSIGRLTRDIAPHVAPEARTSGRVGKNSDTYSAGILLLELLTCRRPTGAAPLSTFRLQDAFPEGVRNVLARCFAEPDERISILELHRSLQELLAAGPAPVSTADLAFFLYTLLNPESRGLPATDAESTNPIAADQLELEPTSDEPFLMRRRSDVVVFSADAYPMFDDEEAPFPAALPREPQRLLPPPARDPHFALEAVSKSATQPVRLGGGIYLAAAAAVIIAFAALVTLRGGGAPIARTPAQTAAVTARSSSPVAGPAMVPAPSEAVAIPEPQAPARPGLVRAKRGNTSGHAATPAVNRRAHRRDSHASDAAEVRRSAEDARFQAAWARIEAERREASDLAAETFAAGRSAEAAADRLLRRSDYAGAREGFARAATLFQGAESASRQTRLARIQLSSPSL